MVAVFTAKSRRWSITVFSLRMLLNWNHLISFESVDICRLDRNKIGFHHIVRVHSERLVDAHDSEKDPETTRKYVHSAIVGSSDSAVLGMSLFL